MQASTRFLVTSALALMGCGSDAPPAPVVPQAVRVAEVRVGPVVEGRSHLAEVVPAVSVRVLAQVPGAVAALGPPEGKDVERSTMIARIAAPDVSARVARVGAERRRAERERDFACEQLETDRVLAASGDLPAVQLDLSEKACASADLAVEAAAAAEREASAVGTRAVETAPFDGHVTDYLVDVGQTVMPGTPVARFGSHERHLRLRMVAADLEGVRPGTRVVTDGGRGVVVEVGVAAHGPARLYEVLVAPDGAHDLRLGQTVTATVVLDERLETSAVPEEALVADPDGAYVLVEEDMAVRRVAVEPGPRQDGWVAIEPSLPEGTRVVTSAPRSVDLLHPVLPVMP
jgi:RND family efflux transporter MFP subunit